MAHVFIVGATGGVGTRLIPMLTEAGHDITGLHRKPEQADDLRGKGVTPVLGDIIEMSPDDLAAAMTGADTIIFSAGAAGSGKERATAIDGDGPIKLIEAAQQVGIQRLLVVSVFPEAGRTADLGEGFEHYMAQKKRAEVAVAQSGLDWVLLRPGTLTDEDHSGEVSLNRVSAYGDVSRQNVAAVLAHLVDRPDVAKETLELTDGATKIEVALAALRR